MEICNTVGEVATKTIPKRNKYEKEKRLPEEVLKTAEKIREVKGKGKRESYTQWKADIQRKSRRDKEVFATVQCKN